MGARLAAAHRHEGDEEEAMRRSPLSSLVLQGALSIPGNSRPVSVPLVQRHFPPSTGSGSSLAEASWLHCFCLLRTCQLGARHQKPRVSFLPPSLPSIVGPVRRLWLFPPQADHLRPQPLHRQRLCVLSSRHFACGTLRPISALPGSSNTGPRLLCSGGCPDPPHLIPPPETGNDDEIIEGGCFADIVADEEIKVCIVTDGAISEPTWVEESAKDVTLQEVLNKVINGWGVKEKPVTVLFLTLKHGGWGRGRATKQDGRLERELRAEAVPEGRRGREDSRTTHRVRCPSTPTTAATRNHVRGPRRSGTQGRKLATRPRPIRPGKRGGVASSEDRGRRARSGKEQAEQAAGTAGVVTTRIHLPTTQTNTRGPSPPHRETGRRSKVVRPLRQPGEKPKER
ncbi:hypothetical protein NDU88_006350 [Pleurodeles waltl]|uniref:Uncharacterized protein n=1 Tax=Pleurodeles waltl TaxID=8319 RepID=A0AAV7WC99_PLEWA|nr:hypothetical protein NDU88_006350 [Pleurodeles waltl]